MKNNVPRYLIETMDTFGKRLRAARLRRRITQAQLGQRIGVRQNTIAGYETDERQPDLATLTRMAQSLDVSVDYLLGLPEAVRESTIPYSVNLDLESRKGRLLHRLAEPGLSILERQEILGQLVDVEKHIAALALNALPHKTAKIFANEDHTANSEADFAVTISDDALMEVKIEKGDIAICTVARKARHGDLVAARVGDGDTVELRFLVQKGDQWLLRAANPDFPDQPIDPKIGLILGVVLTIEKKAPRLEL